MFRLFNSFDGIRYKILDGLRVPSQGEYCMNNIITAYARVMSNNNFVVVVLMD